jgi:hypothetical protein
MNFLARLRAMLHLGDAAGRLGTATHVGTIEAADAARLQLLGDIEGQTARAQAFAAELDRRAKQAR